MNCHIWSPHLFLALASLCNCRWNWIEMFASMVSQVDGWGCGSDRRLTFLSASPCLPRAPRLRTSDTIRVSTITGHDFSYQPFAVKLFTGPKLCLISPQQHKNSNSRPTRKSIHFQACFQGKRIQKNCSQGRQQNEQKWKTPSKIPNISCFKLI